LINSYTSDEKCLSGKSSFLCNYSSIKKRTLLRKLLQQSSLWIKSKNWWCLERSRKDAENVTNQDLFRSFVKKLEQFNDKNSKQRVTTFLIRILKQWLLWLYDGTLRTFTTLKIKRSYDACKDLEKMQKVSTDWASYLQLFRNGGQLKSRYQTSQIPRNQKRCRFCISFLDMSFSNCCNFLTVDQKRSRLVAYSASDRALFRSHQFSKNFIHRELRNNNFCSVRFLMEL
jgi:hypothetical protein